MRDTTVTVRELINDLLDCDMDKVIKIKTFGNREDVTKVEYDEEAKEYVMNLDYD